jgi:hypothetical protein
MFVPIYHAGSSCRCSLNRKLGGGELSVGSTLCRRKGLRRRRRSRLVFTEIERQVLDRPVISPVGTLNEIWGLINKMYIGFSVQNLEKTM